MIKKITMLIFLIFCTAAISLGQLASMENKTVSPNTACSIAVIGESLGSINSMTLNIGFDPVVLDYVGFVPQGLTSGITANVSGSVLNITWSNVVPQTPADTLLKLIFFYKGGSSSLDFMPGCEFTSLATPFAVGYISGGISAAPCQPGDGIAALGNAVCSSGGQFEVPVNFSNFQNAGAFTLYIDYDETMFAFINLSKMGVLSNATVNGGNGLITIAWTTSSPGGLLQNINTSPTNFLKLNFQCLMAGNSSITYEPGCVFSGGAGVNLPVCFTDGIITKNATLHTAQLDTLTGVNQGDEIVIPLMLNVNEPVSAFTLNIDFNAPVLSYTGFDAVDPASLGTIIANSVGNTLTIAYTANTPVVLTGAFINLKFKYNGVGAGLIGFSGFNQFDKFNNITFLPEPINVDFFDGYVTPGFNPANTTVEIGTLSGNIGDLVDVPVYIEGSSTNQVGAATMFIGFDNTKLLFIGSINPMNGTTVDAFDDQISIAWADPGAVIQSNVTFIKLRFKYIGGGSLGCGTDVYFKNDLFTQQSCEIANATATTIPANWVNGGINLFPIQAVISGAANPLVGSSVVYTSDPGMMNYDWTVSGGGVIISGNGTPSVTVNWTALGPGSVTVNYHNPSGCYLGTSKVVEVISSGLLADLQGFVTYKNSVSQGMNGVVISLYNSLGNLVGSPTTTLTNGTHGFYQFTGIPQDYYTMMVQTTAPWAGTPYVSGLDALLVELHTAGVYPLNGINLLAANVNGGPTVNATDALLIKKRVIGEISSFPAGDWVFDNGLINAFTSPVSVYNFQGLCTGDVNGSYNPVVGVKSSSSLMVIDAGVQRESLNSKFSYSVKSGFTGNLGAMTLFLNFNESLFKLHSVTSPFTGMEYSVKNGQITVVWTDLAGYNLSEDVIMLNLEMEMKSVLSNPVYPIMFTDGCEFADVMANIFSAPKVKLAKVATGTSELLFAVSPNPVSAEGSFSFSLPTDGTVKIDIANIFGSKVLKAVEETYSAGSHKVLFNAQSAGLSAGIYFATLSFSGNGTNHTKVVKLIIR